MRSDVFVPWHTDCVCSLSFVQVKLVNALPIERQHAAWVGGSILGICGSFQQLWLTKSEYEELGPQRAALRFDH